MLPYWLQLLLFMGVVLLVALYGLTVSGHFPAEFRGKTLQGSGAITLWGSMAAAAAAAGVALLHGAQNLPWHAAVISGGAMLLFAPLVLQRFPDPFVNGRRALLTFSAGAALLAAAMWIAF